MGKRASLDNAKATKSDEYYTRLEDIELELKYYKHHFKDAHVFLNCDDPEESNFWRYFAINFKSLGIKQLTSTHYKDGEKTYRQDMYRDVPKEAIHKDTVITLEEVGIELPIAYITPFEGEGDFRSEESIEILKECDFVITNPPYSLWSEYFLQLTQYDKKFLILGNLNALTYSEVFPYVMSGKLWWGATRHGSGSMWFRVPEHVPDKKSQKFDEDGNRYQTIGMSCWYTNMDHDIRHEDLVLSKFYEGNEKSYLKYENYDAIEVNLVRDIPMDYEGAMGVPITYIGKHNPDQFELLGATESEGKGFSNGLHIQGTPAQAIANDVKKYKRLFIRNKKPISKAAYLRGEGFED